MFWVVISFVIFSGDNSAKTVFEATEKSVAPITMAIGDLGGMFGFAGVPLVSAETLYYLRSYGLLLALAILGVTPIVRDTANRLYASRIGKVVAVLEPIVMIGMLLVCTAYLVAGSFSPFLYFRF
jgi:alginate O-acetyltransferase complex protein AlgI